MGVLLFWASAMAFLAPPLTGEKPPKTFIRGTGENDEAAN